MNRLARFLVAVQDISESPEWQTAFIMALIAAIVLGILVLRS